MILLQLTVMGYLNTGKTSLINYIMNNDIYTNYIHTDLPTVYYKVHKEKKRRFCVEIEDTSVDVDMNIFTSMLRKEITTDNRNMKNPVFSLFDKPSIPFQVGDEYNSISYGRMAYFLVFDLTNESTLEYVKMIYTSMSSVYDQYYVIISYFEKCFPDFFDTLKPFISLVGNKYDLVTEDCEVFRRAENFANENMVQLWLTSAITGKNVKKLFTHTINMVYNNTNLWKYDIEESGSESTES